MSKQIETKADTGCSLQRMVRRLEVTLVKLSVCSCGFPLLKDSIGLGEVYEIDPDQTILATLICGGCQKRHCVRAVWVYAKGESRGGFLPESAFSHKSSKKPGVKPPNKN